MRERGDDTKRERETERERERERERKRKKEREREGERMNWGGGGRNQRQGIKIMETGFWERGRRESRESGGGDTIQTNQRGEG